MGWICSGKKWGRESIPIEWSIIREVTQSVEQVVAEFMKIAAKHRRATRDPRKARGFLIRAGIAVKREGKGDILLFSHRGPESQPILFLLYSAQKQAQLRLQR